jgi:hypothetical protein
MNALNFQQVLDTDPPSSAAGEPISQQPQIDATVLELNEIGQITSGSLVLMSPQYPHGVAVPLDQNYSTDDVEWSQWDDTGWYTDHAVGAIPIVSNRRDAKYKFMAPYPASTLKLMVAFGVLQLAQKHVISLNQTYDYVPESTVSAPLCGGDSSNTVRNYLDASLTYSDDASSCALIKLLWDHNDVGALNREFRNLGLPTLQLAGTLPTTGGDWSNSITMTSLDAAKLMAIINGGGGVLWRTPTGKPVIADQVLSPAMRSFFTSELLQQGYNDQLSTTNWCGASYPAAGIPQLTANRWIASNGTMTVDGQYYGRSVLSCQKSAQVTFAHKTGWVSDGASDVGIVHSLPGKPWRSYIIAVYSNLGGQYIDPDQPAEPAGVTYVAVTQKLAQLGLAIDRYETSAHG